MRREGFLGWLVALFSAPTAKARRPLRVVYPGPTVYPTCGRLRVR